MVRKHKAFVVILILFLAGAATIGGCSTSLDADANPRMVAADDGGQEEVLGQDDLDDNTDRPEGSNRPGAATGFLLSLGYVAMTIGSAALPLLMIM